MVALPAISIEPSASTNGSDGGASAALLFTAEVIIDGSWEIRSALSIEQLSALLEDWSNGPEEALGKWWGRPAPMRQQPRVPSHEPAAKSKSPTSASIAPIDYGEFEF